MLNKILSVFNFYQFIVKIGKVSFSTPCVMPPHKICRNNCYDKSSSGEMKGIRFPVPDDKVSWAVDYPNYKPVSFSIPGLSNKPWADPDIGAEGFKPRWNELDGNVNRKSHAGKYDVSDGYPQNPCGRTGLTGRGRLGRWGPNHAADPIVTQWKRDHDGSVVKHPLSKLPILQFVAIKRHDCGKWAIPGGMVDPGEKITLTLKREFCEEAMNSLILSPEEKCNLDKLISNFFESGNEFYKGYVDDPRNTDNAWMETVASNFHDDNGNIVGKFPLQAGDDAAQVRWMDINLNLELYANHIDFLKQVAHLKKAHI